MWKTLITRTLFEFWKMYKLSVELNKYQVDKTALQEIRWEGKSRICQKS